MVIDVSVSERHDEACLSRQGLDLRSLLLDRELKERRLVAVIFPGEPVRVVGAFLGKSYPRCPLLFIQQHRLLHQGQVGEVSLAALRTGDEQHVRGKRGR